MNATLQAERRTSTGKNEARRTRAAGRLPAVLYGPASGGGAEAAMPITVDPKALSRILRSESGTSSIINLSLDGQTIPVLVKDFLVHPVSHALLHADFYRVAMDRRVKVTIPVTLKGEAKGVKQQGGLLDFVTRRFEVECLPSDIPEHVEIDVTELMIGQGVRIRDLAQGARWTPTGDPDTMLVHVVSPKSEETAAEGEAAAAEPEVIKKGKAEKEEG
ncbi:MAG TPA: 50S ribosomal protein L25 [Vicinamibacterales bacterium]